MTDRCSRPSMCPRAAMEVYTDVPSEQTRQALKKVGDSLEGLS